MEILDGLYMIGSGEFGISDAYDCHVYLLDGGDDAVVIDCGSGRHPERIMAALTRRMPAQRVSRVLLTHLHADHSGGAAFFQKAGIRVLASAEETRITQEKPQDVIEAFNRAKRDGSYPENYEYPFITPDGLLDNGERITVGSRSITCIQVKGHNAGLLCYLVEGGGKRLLFSSDYVFLNGRIGLQNCPGSSLEDYRRDIVMLAGLKIDALLPGHRMFTISDGQRHIDLAIANLSKAFVPKSF